MNTDETHHSADTDQDTATQPKQKPASDKKLEELKTRIKNATPDSDLPQAEEDLPG